MGSDILPVGSKHGITPSSGANEIAPKASGPREKDAIGMGHIPATPQKAPGPHPLRPSEAVAACTQAATEKLIDAIERGEIDGSRIAQLMAQGADLNAMRDGQTIFYALVSKAPYSELSGAYKAVNDPAIQKTITSAVRASNMAAMRLMRAKRPVQGTYSDN